MLLKAHDGEPLSEVHRELIRFPEHRTSRGRMLVPEKITQAKVADPEQTLVDLMAIMKDGVMFEPALAVAFAHALYVNAIPYAVRGSMDDPHPGGGTNRAFYLGVYGKILEQIRANPDAPVGPVDLPGA